MNCSFISPFKFFETLAVNFCQTTPRILFNSFQYFITRPFHTFLRNISSFKTELRAKKFSLRHELKFQKRFFLWANFYFFAFKFSETRNFLLNDTIYLFSVEQPVRKRSHIDLEPHQNSLQLQWLSLIFGQWIFKLLECRKRESHNNKPELILKLEASTFKMYRLFYSKAFLHHVAGGKVKALFFSKILEISVEKHWEIFFNLQ